MQIHPPLNDSVIGIHRIMEGDLGIMGTVKKGAWNADLRSVRWSSNSGVAFGPSNSVEGFSAYAPTYRLPADDLVKDLEHLPRRTVHVKIRGLLMRLVHGLHQGLPQPVLGLCIEWEPTWGDWIQPAVKNKVRCLMASDYHSDTDLCCVNSIH